MNDHAEDDAFAIMGTAVVVVGLIFWTPWYVWVAGTVLLAVLVLAAIPAGSVYEPRGIDPIEETLRRIEKSQYN